ncbi:MAG: amino acid ABC transporter permease [Cellulosilyticaceae bacterium]
MTWQMVEAFFETFMREKYYLLLLEGIQSTLLLTLFATIIGLIIGIGVAIIQVVTLPKKYQKLDRVLKGITKVYIDLIRGTPAIVQVTFIWLVVFGSVRIPKVLAGGIAFGINSGAYMAELIRAGIQGIDKGQMEAGRSLGLNYKQTMRFVIMPQALKQMLPALVSEFIVLLKETAVIGMVGGMDIMKAGSVMISNTGNAIIPLTMVAACYLVLTGIFTKIMRGVEKKITQGR